MSNATEQLRSTRSDARAFADAFAGADDAFTFGPDAGESRTLTLAELGEVLALDGPVALDAPSPSERGARAAEASTDRHDLDAGAVAADDDQLLSIDELGDALARPVAPAEDLEFDFGTSAHERARRRTAARLDASPSSRRRASGPAARPRRPAEPTLPATSGAATSPRPADGAKARPVAGAPARSAAVAGARPAAATARSSAATHRPSRAVAAPALRATPIDRLRANPDRVALWAVLLGIVLVLIAFTSGSAGAVALPVLAL